MSTTDAPDPREEPPAEAPLTDVPPPEEAVPDVPAPAVAETEPVEPAPEETVAAKPVPDENVPAKPAAAPSRHRARTIVSSVVGVLAVLLLLVTVVAVWAKATVLQSDRVADLVGDALAQPEVQSALAAYLTDQVVAATDLDTRLTGLLPGPLDRFAPAIASGAYDAVERALTKVLSNPDVQNVVTTIVEKAHARVMSLLQGDGLRGGFNVDDGTITLNLLPLVGRGLTALQSIGLLDNVQVPAMTPDGDPAQQQAALEAALGRDLPDGFAQLVVYQSDKVSNAQDAVQTAEHLLVVAKRALWLLIIGSVVLVAATILIAARRTRAALMLALGTAGAMVVLRSAVRRVADQAPSLASKPGGKAAIDAILGGASTSLLRGAGIVLLVALVASAVLLFVRDWDRGDLVLVAAVMLGAITFAVIGATIWGLLAGVVVGVAVPFAARRLPWTAPPSPAVAGT